MPSASGLLGAAILVAAASSGGFSVIVTLQGASVTDFDGQLAVSKVDTVGEFDAKVCVEISASQMAPSAVIITPTVANSSGIPNFTVQFSGIGYASGQKTIDQHTWFFHDKGTVYVSGGLEAMHTFTSSGSHLVVFRVVDSDGLMSFAARRILTYSGVALTLPSLQISGIPITSGDAPLSINFEASGGAVVGSTIYGYQWNFGHGKTSTRQNPSGITFGVPGGYMPVCTIWDSRGVLVSDSLFVGVNN